MHLVATYGVVLILAALMSGLAARTALSTALLVLAGGIVIGPGVLDLVHVQPSFDYVSSIAEIALVTVLFTDGQRLPLPHVRSILRLGGRAVLVGMPLTVLGIAGLAWALTGLTVVQALLVGAVLAPTDPVFAAAIVQHERVPTRLRRLLNVESGVNDGLALPLVIILLAQSGTPHESVHAVQLVGELLGGVALGVALPLAVAGLRRLPGLGAHAAPTLLTLATGITIYGMAETLHANAYLAAFIGGVTYATALPDIESEFDEFGEQISEAAKLLALLVFAMLLTPQLLGQVGVGGWVLAGLALLLVRPAALMVSLVGARLDRRERLVVAWFGPKGFASVVYGLLVLESGAPESQHEFAIIAACVAVSVLAHSSTDVWTARWLVGDQDATADADTTAVEGAFGTPDQGEEHHE